MKNSFGESITVTLFGESHGAAIGCVIDGLAPGIEVDFDFVRQRLERRRPVGLLSTQRQETDDFEILSGVFEGYTTGTPLALIIKNKDTKSKDYSELLDKPRPGHADYTASLKYHGFQDYRGGGHFSGRLTAPLVAAGAVIYSALMKKGVRIGSHIKSLHGISDRAFDDIASDTESLSKKSFPALSDEKEELMKAEILKARDLGDSVGGIIESVISGMPAGVGEPWFDSMESVISHILFSVPAVKGVAFGLGFGFSELYGSEANDAFATDGNLIYTKTNNNGGINGGITNGMPITVSTAIKPTPSIFKEQDTVSLSMLTNEKLTLSGRHDPAVIHRACPVIDALLAVCVADMLTQRYGTDYLGGNKN